MSHQPFESWLLSEDTLPPEQASSLREHLRECEACRQTDASWTSVRVLFRVAPGVAPATGFTARWLARLAEQRRQRERKQSLVVFGVNALIAATLLAIWAWQVVEAIQSPSQLVAEWIYRLTALMLFADTTRNVLVSIWRAILTSVPLPVWILVPGFLSLVMVLWLVVFQQLTSARRVQL